MSGGQNDALGMNWLSRLIAGAVRACGLEPAGKASGNIQFFIYDVVKIMLLPGAVIPLISCIQSYFPPERSRRILAL